MGCTSCQVRYVMDGRGVVGHMLGGSVNRSAWLPSSGGEESSGGDCGCGCDGAGTCAPRTSGALTPSQDARLEAFQRSYLSAGERSTGELTTMQRAAVTAMSDDALSNRYSELLGLSTLTPAQQDELDFIEVERERRVAIGEEPSDDSEARREFDAAGPAERRRIAEAAARRVEVGIGAAADARRDRIIAEGVRGGFDALNGYLDREYRTRIEQIRGDRDITLRRLTNDDRERQRIYDLERLRLRGGGGTGGPARSKGGGAALGALALLGLLVR